MQILKNMTLYICHLFVIDCRKYSLSHNNINLSRGNIFDDVQILLFCLLPANCFCSFFAWMCLSNCFVCNCLCALQWGNKNVDCYQWIYLSLSMRIFNYLQFIIIFREKQGKVCSALLCLAKN